MKASTGYSREYPDKSPNLYGQIRKLMYQNRISPRKRLGQSFVIEEGLLHSMISYADVGKHDVILEVGAGLGFLTRLLSRKCKKVVAVEIDAQLLEILHREFSNLDNVELIEGDVLTASIPSFDKVVSTPPYSISSPLLFWLLEKSFKLAVLTFQEEFARRLTAPIGSKNYSRLTIATYYRADAELLDHVPETSFYPIPDVDSIIVRLKPKEKPFIVKDEEVFFDLVKTAFTQRNKKLRNALLPFLTNKGLDKDKAQLLADELTFHDKRVREIAPEDFGALTNEILEKTSSLQ